MRKLTAKCVEVWESHPKAYSNQPVLDVSRENVYVITDSNHGYKIIGVGKLVAQEIRGESNRLLEPFHFSRYAGERLHPVSSSSFPWS